MNGQEARLSVVLQVVLKTPYSYKKILSKLNMKMESYSTVEAADGTKKSGLHSLKKTITVLLLNTIVPMEVVGLAVRFTLV